MKKTGHVKISNTRNGQFKVTLVAIQGEKLSVSETIKTYAMAKKNVLAQMKLYGSEQVLVQDATKNDWYWLYRDGKMGD